MKLITNQERKWYNYYIFIVILQKRRKMCTEWTLFGFHLLFYFMAWWLRCESIVCVLQWSHFTKKQEFFKQAGVPTSWAKDKPAVPAGLQSLTAKWTSEEWRSMHARWRWYHQCFLSSHPLLSPSSPQDPLDLASLHSVSVPVCLRCADLTSKHVNYLVRS